MAQKREKKIGLLSRLLGAAIGGGGTWVALMVVSWEPSMPIAAGLSGAMAVAGLAFGPAVWQAVVGIA